MTPAATPDLAAELAAPVRKVLVSTVFAELFTARADDGWRLSFEWGEPDADGFYTPTITATDDGKVVVDAGELRSLRATGEERDRLATERNDAIGALLAIYDVTENQPAIRRMARAALAAAAPAGEATE